MDRKAAEQGVKPKTVSEVFAACLWFYKGSWYARQDSNL